MRGWILIAGLLVFGLAFGGSAQARQTYYAYAAFGALDVNNKPVIDPETGKRITTGVCIIWRSNYVTDNPDVSILDSNFYSKYSYRVDKKTAQLTIYQVEAPRTVAITSGTGWFPVGGSIVFPATLTVPLYPRPQSSWPCSERTWKLALSLPVRVYQPPRLMLPAGGLGYHYIPTGPEMSCRVHGGHLNLAGNCVRY